MTAPTARAYGTHVVLSLPPALLDDVFIRLARHMADDPAVLDALHDLCNAQAWIDCPEHCGERVAPGTYQDRADVALRALHAAVEDVGVALHPGSARDLGRDIVHAADEVLAQSTEDLLHALEAQS